MDFVSVVGTVAALLTTASNLPQAIKCWRTRSTDDISFKAFTTLAVGQAMWVFYGFLNTDIPLMAANAISASLSVAIIVAKVRNG